MRYYTYSLNDATHVHLVILTATHMGLAFMLTIMQNNVLRLYFDFAVEDSIALTLSNFDAYESEEEVDVCAVIMADALERDIIVHLTSQDSTARSKYVKRKKNWYH